MTDSSSWKLIRLRSFIPIRSHARRNSAVVINLERHGRFVTDKCFMRLTERNRRNYGFYIKPVRDFRKLRRRNIRVRFRPIRKTPGFCGFWKGYRLPSIQVNLHFWFLIETVAVRASDKVCQWTRVCKEACAFSNVEVNCIPLGSGSQSLREWDQSRPSMQSTCAVRAMHVARSTRAADPHLIFKISAVEHVVCFALSTMFILSLFCRL